MFNLCFLKFFTQKWGKKRTNIILDSYTPEALLEVVKKFVCADYFETQTKNCVVVLNKQVAATFKHGTHEHLRHGQILDIYDYNDSRIPVMCAYIHPTMDFILYVRLEGEFEFIPKIGFPIQGSHYILLVIFFDILFVT